jgi:hypothetical protein
MNTSSPTAPAAASVVSLSLDVVTAAEAAAVLRCMPWTVVQFIRAGMLPASRPVGPLGPWLIQRRHLALFLARAMTPDVHA